jgi:hypothetical protein
MEKKNIKKKKKKKKNSMDNLRNFFYRDKKSKKLFTIFLILRVLVIYSAMREVAMGNYTNTFFCIVALVLFTMPAIIEDTLKIEFPTVMEVLIYLFIYSAWVLGEINNFYEIFPYWDTILHTINGFLCAGLGFSFIDILNRKSDKFNLSPLYLAIVSLCFSVTIGVMWEFFEFSMDRIFLSDMQKDEIVYNISTVTLDETKSNKTVKIKDIDYTTITTKSGEEVKINGYLDIGIFDTTEDLFVNFVGAFIFSIFGFFYVYNRDDKSFIKHFIPKSMRKRKRKKKIKLESV